MPLAQRQDPYRSFRFRIEIDGIEVGGFSEASGLQHEIETEEYREGGVNGFVHKLPKAARQPYLILKRGLTDADNLWKWSQSVGRNQTRIERKAIRFVLLNSEGAEALAWRCLQAYPVKWAGPDLKGDANHVAFETLELAHCGIERS